MRVVATVESRMDSSRLPGKNAMPILGRPMIARLLERLQRAALVDTVCLATTTEAADAALEQIGREAGVEVFRGSTDDVLGRVLGAARAVQGDLLVEITGDCPLVDPAIIDAAVARFLAGGYDYVTNILDELTFPVGFDVQVYSVKLLSEVAVLTTCPDDRVNVTPFIYRNPQRYRLLNLRAPAELHRPRYRLCVDYQEDFEVLTDVFLALHREGECFSAREVIAFLDGRPDLVDHNTRREDLFGCPSSGGAADQEFMTL